MILDEYVHIKISGMVKEHYINKGYEFNFKEKIKVKVCDLIDSSHIKINISCDNCKKESKQPYRDYVSYLKKYNIYYCHKCSKIKIEKSNIKKYGVKRPLQNSSIKKKQEDTIFRKYGYNNVFQSLEIQNKIKSTNLIKYGFECPSKSEVIKNKIEKTCIEKYGFKSFSYTTMFLEKSQNTYNIKYGGLNPMCVEEIKNKFLNKMISLGYIIKNTEYDVYRKKVNSITRKNKNKIFENWNGYDYYDNDYIKENLYYNSNHSEYPTIDHKYSIFNGYKNNISPEIIGGFENLCITKRILNSKKGSKNFL